MPPWQCKGIPMAEKPGTQTIRLAIDSSLEYVFLIGLCVRGICSYLPFDEVTAYQVEVSVVEAVNNAVKHAYKNQAGHDVEVLISLFEDRIVFEVCDVGRSMDSERIPTSTIDFDPNRMEKLPEGGMGLHIIRSTMDSVEYRKTERRNVLTMSKLLPNKSRESR